jgi:hypothetical protein
MRMIFGGHIDKYDFHLAGLNDECAIGAVNGKISVLARDSFHQEMSPRVVAGKSMEPGCA